jgi:hypothetical protein
MSKHNKRGRVCVRLPGAITVIGGSLVIGATPVAEAATLVVDTATDNPGDGLTLREALTTAADGDVITFDPLLAGATITLDNVANGTFQITNDLTIEGLGESSLTLTSNDGSVLYVYNADLVVSDLTIANSDVYGVKLRDVAAPYDSSLTVERVTISDSGDAGIQFRSRGGDITVTDSTISGSGSHGIRATYAMDLTVSGTSIVSNDRDGVYSGHVDGDLTLTGSESSDNDGPGMRSRNVSGDLVVSGSTFARNNSAGVYLASVLGTSVISDASFEDNRDAVRLLSAVGDVMISDVESIGSVQRLDGDLYILGPYSLPPVVPNVTVSTMSGVGHVDVRLRRFNDVTLDDVTLDGDSVSVSARYATGDVSMSGLSLASESYGEVYVRFVGGDFSLDGSDIDGSVTGNMIDGAMTISDVAIDASTAFYRDGLEARNTSDVTISDTTIANGGRDGIDIRYVDANGGAGLDGDVVLERVVVSGAGDGGVRLSRVDGTVVLTDVEAVGSAGDGMSFYYTGDVSLDRVTVGGSGSTGLGSSQGVGVVDIVSSTFVDNGSDDNQPALELYAGVVSIAHSTISGNDASGEAAVETRYAMVTIDHSILTENGAPATQVTPIGTGSFVVTNSLVPVGSGLGVSNVESDTAGLSPLGDFGGVTQVAPPATGSPAIDAGDAAIVGEPDLDQRGEARKVDAIDIGAVEVRVGTVSVSDATVDENAGVVSVELTRVGIDFPITVDLATSDGTATAPDDFAATSTQVTLPAGVVGPITVEIPIVVDTLAEPDESFGVGLSNASGAAIADGSATVTILDVPPPLAALAPARFVDTRSGQTTVDGDFNGDGKLDAGASYTVQIAGRGDVPADAKAVTMNVTAVGAEAQGFVTVHPCLDTPPNVSSLNYTAGVNLGNEVTIPLDATGKACFFTRSAVHLTVDVVAYVPDESRGFPVTPARLLDTRPGQSTTDGVSAGRGKLPAGGTEFLQVAGRGGVPADAAAVIVNVTGIQAESRGFLTVHPCLPEAPNASSLNLVQGVNRGNELIAEVDANGDICLFSSTSVHLTVDVTGYVPAGTALNSVTPARLLDTRSTGETIDGSAQAGGKRQGGSETTLQISGRGGVPVGARAAIVNVTAIGPEATGFITVHPCLTPRPTTAALNYVPGVNGANEIVASLNDDGEICLFTKSTTHLAVDVVGYLA